jgi:subtilisin family serine protease
MFRTHIALSASLALCAAACGDGPFTPPAAPVERSTAALTVAAPDPVAARPPRVDKVVRARSPIPRRYLVVLREPVAGAAVRSNAEAAHSLAARHGGVVSASYQRAIRGFLLEADERAAQATAQDPAVALVAEDGVVELDTAQYGAEWGLIRVDQRNLPLDDNYGFDRRGKGVHVYVVDTGIRTDHAEFGGRASADFTTINDGRGAQDCRGHGTHVAATIGGQQYGIAKKVNLHAVRVFPCSGGASSSDVITALDWVIANHVSPAVVNMSLGGGQSAALDQAVQNVAAAGITVVVSAGNSATNACNQSPAAAGPAAGVITVASSSSSDQPAGSSNFGPCVDLYAPGVGVKSAWHTSATATNTLSGTSMAAPHVAGAAALLLDRFATVAPADLEIQLRNSGTQNALSGVPAGTPNLLLFTPFIHGGDQYLIGDWDGDGISNLAVRRGGCVYMDTNFDGLHDILQCYGMGWAEDEYLVGDWDGDGRDNLAVRRGGHVLMDTNFDGVHDIDQAYGWGEGEDEYLVGDWDGDGRDNLAVRRGGCVLMDYNYDGTHDQSQCYGGGWAEDDYLVGDWNGDGRDNLAVRRGGCVLKDTNFDTVHDQLQCYGLANGEDGYLMGDWDGDKIDNLSVRRGNCVLKDTNFDGTHDQSQCYGFGN